MSLIDHLHPTGAGPEFGQKIAALTLWSVFLRWVEGGFTDAQAKAAIEDVSGVTLDAGDVAIMLEIKTAYDGKTSATAKLAFIVRFLTALLNWEQGTIDRDDFKSDIGVLIGD